MQESVNPVAEKQAEKKAERGKGNTARTKRTKAGSEAPPQTSLEARNSGLQKGSKPTKMKDSLSPKTKPLAKKPARSVDKAGVKTAQKSCGVHNRELGRRGEDAAARFLERRGYELVQRNWICAAGEADIIARDDDTLVFIEVKTRSDTQKGLPSEAVDAQKRKRYECIAALFLRDYEVVDIPVRFDVVSLVTVAPDRALIRHHINAFTAG